MRFMQRTLDHDQYSFGLDTVIGTSDLLGHLIECRSSIRNRQDVRLTERFIDHSTVALGSPLQSQLFSVAPLDILVTEVDGQPQFHIIELNGTGIGGITNLPAPVLSSILASMAEVPQQLPMAHPLVLIASSGKESDSNPRLNKLIHEKIMYADAMARGFEETHGTCHVRSLTRLLREPSISAEGGPLIVVGYMKDFLNTLQCLPDGTLQLLGRPVHAIVNDRFCANVLDKFQGGVDLSRLLVMNRTFHAGADKGVVYSLLNEFLQCTNSRYFPSGVYHRFAHDRQQLVQIVLSDLEQGRKVVIKPHGTGLGHGIEFFLNPEEDIQSIVSRIDGSLHQTEEFYGMVGGALPYTICDFLDARTIQAPGHDMHGRKFELRVVVYRNGDCLQAFPSIAKVSSMVYDREQLDRQMLINNITPSTVATKQHGTDFMLPLTNSETMNLLGLSEEHLTALCQTSARFVRHTLAKLERDPTWFGLPTHGVQARTARAYVAPLSATR